MDINKIKELIKKGECEYLDFKREFNEIGDLIHDILCLANAKTANKQDRYLIFGVDDSKKIVGCGSGLKENVITDTLKNAHINTMPSFSIESFIIDAKQVDILIIKDMPCKPYYFTKDFTYQKIKVGRITVRAGVVYERANSTNTGKDKCANPENVKWMYKEQFDSDHNIEKEVLEELKHPERWRYVTGKRFYHFKKPGMSINISDNGEIKNRVKFTVLFQDKIATVYKYEIHYNNNLIKELEVLTCASGELLVPYPNHKLVGEALGVDTSPMSYYYIKDSYAHLLKNFLTHHFPTLNTASSKLTKFDSVVALFDSEEEAINKLEDDYNSNKRKYTYFQRKRGGCDVIMPDETYFVAWENRVNTVDDKMQ